MGDEIYCERVRILCSDGVEDWRLKARREPQHPKGYAHDSAEQSSFMLCTSFTLLVLTINQGRSGGLVYNWHDAA